MSERDGEGAIDKEEIGKERTRGVVENLICESSATLLDGSDFTDGELYSL